MLPPEQQKELETAIFNYLSDKKYGASALAIVEESAVLNGTTPNRTEDRILERKWFTIVKLQTKILELERKLNQTEEIIAKSVRTLVIPDSSVPNGKDALDTPVVKMTKVYKGHKDTVNCVAVHGTEPFFASGSSDSTIRLVDYELQNNIAILKGHTHSVNCLSWTKEELASGSSDMSIKIWKSGNKTNAFDLNDFFCARTLLGHEHIVSGLIGLDDTELTVSVSRDKTIRIWDRSTGFCRKTLADSHDDWIRCVDANKKFMVTSGNDKRLCVFDMTQLLAFEKGSGASSATYINTFFVHDNFVDAVRIYKEGKLQGEEHIAVTASRDKTIGVWNFLTGVCLVKLTGHENWVRDIGLIEGYNLLLSVGDDKSLRIWDLRKKKQVYIESNAHDHFVSCLAVHKEFRIVLTGSVDKSTKIWKIINSNSSEFMSSVY